MEQPLGRLTEALGGCERIASTPIPFTYSVIIHRTIYSYCLLLPFGLVDAIGPMTPVIVAFIAYTFFALEALGSEIEEPFGTAANDLALDQLCWTIETAVLESLGRSGDAPPPAWEWLIDIGPFFDRFGSAKMAVLTSTDPGVRAILQDLQVRKWIDLQRADVAQGLAYVGTVVAAVTPALQATIMTTPVAAQENLALRRLYFG